MWILKSKTNNSIRVKHPIMKCVLQGGHKIEPVIYHNKWSAYLNAFIWGLKVVKVNTIDNPINTLYKHWIYDDYHWVIYNGVFTNINGLTNKI